jgi:flagellar biosynthesis protein FlhF
MIIKTFTAESSAAALKQVRAELGRDAVVLKTRELTSQEHGTRIEITACLDGQAATALNASNAATASRTADVRPATFRNINTREQAAKPSAVPATTAPTSALDKRLDRIEQLITGLAGRTAAVVTDNNATSDVSREMQAVLRNADLPSAMIESILAETLFSSSTGAELEAAVYQLLMQKLVDSVCPTIACKPGDRILFCGPAGAGKTSMMGKLAARLVFQEKRRVTLVTLDRLKIGAMEELQSYADILGARTVEPKAASIEIDRNAITLIDSPAWSADKARQTELIDLVGSMKANIRIAVFSALTRSADVATISDQMSALNPTHVAMTMLDLTDRLGSLFAATGNSAKLVFTTNAPAGIGTPSGPNVEAIVKQVLAMGGDRA